ncbi:hypothetical protein FGO68_gene8681 [Halteria grandinella]|uniref:Uncharacterized protein n=1 Tax=Halteria grandinella TaxID=5974 RepID=A0A8J8SUR5_HALGN|nr:hypothetical protein FGO68_gene8681 [Halteria grandinella]
MNSNIYICTLKTQTCIKNYLDKPRYMGQVLYWQEFSLFLLHLSQPRLSGLLPLLPSWTGIRSREQSQFFQHTEWKLLFSVLLRKVISTKKRQYQHVRSAFQEQGLFICFQDMFSGRILRTPLKLRTRSIIWQFSFLFYLLMHFLRFPLLFQDLKENRFSICSPKWSDLWRITFQQCFLLNGFRNTQTEFQGQNMIPKLVLAMFLLLIQYKASSHWRLQVKNL